MRPVCSADLHEGPYLAVHCGHSLQEHAVLGHVRDELNQIQIEQHKPEQSWVDEGYATYWLSQEQ